ncbi:hypothetical protein DSO57_1008905 [Entomophthora muscae]|uniref:Uncharacterized protein n=1 Tax=Entomophthora muscae TaxID=34485 RepID=A0ACC2SJQ5_9FUNG|nr:hypothetical protein DSO57_1008905 [Entomophthora muscae]
MSQAADKVNLLSYNFFLRPPGIKNNGSDYKEDRLKAFCSSRLPLYDVICFQEVFAFGSTRRSRLIEAGIKTGLLYHVASKRPCIFTGIDGGLLILSRYPIVKCASVKFKPGIHSDALANKGALYARIKVRDNFHIHVFNTHTQASYSSNPTLEDKDVQIRLEQIIELRKFIDQNLVSKPAGEPVFLLGDFNVNSRIPGADNLNASSAEYLAMVQILCEGYHNAEDSDIEAGARSRVFKDLLFEKNGYHPVTYADVDESDTQLPLETCLTHPGDLKSKQSLDYIFQLEEIPIKEKGEGVSFRAEVSSIHVEQLFVDQESQDKFTQLSDHYGVTAQVSIHEL